MFLRKRPSKTHPCGLINKGMTCYLNAILQTLYMTEPFRNHVLRFEAAGSSVDKTSPEENFFKALADLFKKLKDEQTAVDTKEIIKTLDIKNVFEQQDAAQYLLMILHKMPEPSKIFKGIMVTSTVCCSCKKVNEAETEFLSIPLSIDLKGKRDVIYAWMEFMGIHEMKGEDQLYCVNCNAMSDMETEHDIKEWPEILTLQLKRFEMTLTKTEFYFWKNECKVEISSNIQLDSLKCGPSPNYELYVIINHHGSYVSGHYDALIKDDSDNWYHFDDHSVQKMHHTDNLIGRSQSAYLLMYRTVKVKNDDLKAGESATANYRLQTNTSEGKRKNNPGQAQVNKSKEPGQAQVNKSKEPGQAQVLENKPADAELRSCHIKEEGCAVLNSALRSNPSHLRELDLSQNDIRDSGVKQLSELLKHPQCELEKLWLRSCGMREIGCTDLSSALRSNPSHLRELDLSQNDIRDSGVKRLSYLLQDPRWKLEKLWLRSCHIKEEGCAVLSSALRSNPSHLRELDLSDNLITNSGVNWLSDLLNHPRCELEKLWLRSCGMCEIGCTVLSSALRSNPSHLRELDLSQNDIRDSGVKQLSELLKHHNCKLQKLWLRSCGMCEIGCTDLSSALRSNPSHLRELDLSQNDIRDSGVKQLSELLKHSQCELEKLWLRSCGMREIGCTDLCSALSSNPSHLRELDLSQNDIRDSGVKQLSYLLQDPRWKLEKLCLKSSYIRYTYYDAPSSDNVYQRENNTEELVTSFRKLHV